MYFVVVLSMNVIHYNIKLLMINPNIGDFIINLNNPISYILTGMIAGSFSLNPSCLFGLIIALSSTAFIDRVSASAIILGSQTSIWIPALFYSIVMNKKCKKLCLIFSGFNIMMLLIFLPAINDTGDLVGKFSDISRGIIAISGAYGIIIIRCILLLLVTLSIVKILKDNLKKC